MNETAATSGRLSIGVSPMVRKGLMKGFNISRAVRVGEWFFTNGQMDAGDGAKVCNPNDILSQTVSCMRSIYELMAKADCRLAELAHVQVFYLGDSVSDEAAYRQQILEEFPECRNALLVMTRVPSFATVGHELEIDAMAVKGSPAIASNDEDGVRGVRRGDWVFASRRTSVGARDVCRDLLETLGELDAGLGDVCRLYAYYPADLSQPERSSIERDLARTFRESPPVYHATLLPKNTKSDFAVELEVIAHTCQATQKARFGQAMAPADAVEWPFVEALRCGRIVFTSGQFPADEEGTILCPGDIGNQARASMRRLGRALNAAGAEFSDLVKLKTYFEGAWDLENWFDNLAARMESLSDPGPASTGLEGLLPVMPGALLSVDGIAVLDEDASARGGIRRQD